MGQRQSRTHLDGNLLRQSRRAHHNRTGPCLDANQPKATWRWLTTAQVSAEMSYSAMIPIHSLTAASQVHSRVSILMHQPSGRSRSGTQGVYRLGGQPS